MRYLFQHDCIINESTAGADASVEVPKLHNIATHIDYNYHFPLKEWVMIDHDCC